MIYIKIETVQCYRSSDQKDIHYVNLSFKNWQKSSLSENKRAKIVTLFNEGYLERQISVKVSCCKTAVIVNFKTSGSFRDKKRCGRPRKTSLRDDHLIKSIATHSRQVPAERYVLLCFRQVQISVL